MHLFFLDTIILLKKYIASVNDFLDTVIEQYFKAPQVPYSRRKHRPYGIMGGTPLLGKPLGGFSPNPLSLVLAEGVRGSHRVASVMPKGEAFRHQGRDTPVKKRHRVASVAHYDTLPI